MINNGTKTDFQLGIKFFKKKEHKEMFDNKQLFTRHISFYREQEQSLGNGRGDANEGILEYKLETEGMFLKTGNTIKPIKSASIKINLLDDQHIFSFMLVSRNWYKITDTGINLKIPADVSQYFNTNFGEYYSVFCVDSLITALNNTVLPDGNLAYVTHFKVQYTDSQYLNSDEHFDRVNELMDRIEACGDNDVKGKPLMDELLREYMGIKSNEHALENEMRIVLGVFSKEPNILYLR